MESEIKIRNDVFWSKFNLLYNIQSTGNFLALKKSQEILQELGLNYLSLANDDNQRYVEYIFKIVDKRKWMMAKIKYGI